MSGAARQVVRRVVTGVDARGRSAIVSDAPCQKQAQTEQYVSVDLWVSGLPAEVSGSADLPKEADLDPVAGEVMWRWFALGPGERIEFHSTQTVDCMTVLQGQVTLVMEEGMVELRRGDCVIQRGTRHGWFNGGEEECILVGTMSSTAPVPHKEAVA